MNAGIKARLGYLKEIRKNEKCDPNCKCPGDKEETRGRKFLEPLAIKAADLCRRVCQVNDPIFPELFQISYEWIYDSGASRHFCKSEKVSGYMHLAKRIKGVMVNTADGKVEANKVLGMRIERLGNLVTD